MKRNSDLLAWAPKDRASHRHFGWLFLSQRPAARHHAGDSLRMDVRGEFHAALMFFSRCRVARDELRPSGPWHGQPANNPLQEGSLALPIDLADTLWQHRRGRGRLVSAVPGVVTGGMSGTGAYVTDAP